MNKPITLCDRCDIAASCLLNYDGVPCRKNRTVEPTKADRIRSMSDEELAAYLGHASLCVTIQGEDGGAWCSQYGSCNECVRDWLRQEATP